MLGMKVTGGYRLVSRPVASAICQAVCIVYYAQFILPCWGLLRRRSRTWAGRRARIAWKALLTVQLVVHAGLWCFVVWIIAQ
jgi:hypothetical protein